MEGLFKWPIDVVLLVAATLVLALVLGGCQVTVARDDGQVLGQVTVGPDLQIGIPDGKSGSSLNSEPLPR